MIPTGLKVGDIFEDYGVKHIVTKVLPPDSIGLYESEVYTGSKQPQKEEVKEEVINEPPEEKEPEIKAEKPVKKAPVKRATAKKTTAKRTTKK